MEANSSLVDVMQELELRHDELLTRLEELDQRVAQVLKEWTAKPTSAASAEIA